MKRRRNRGASSQARLRSLLEKTPPFSSLLSHPRETWVVLMTRGPARSLRLNGVGIGLLMKVPRLLLNPLRQKEQRSRGLAVTTPPPGNLDREVGIEVGIGVTPPLQVQHERGCSGERASGVVA